MPHARTACRPGPLLCLGAACALLPVHGATAQAPTSGRLVIIGGGLARDNGAVYRAVLDGRDGDGPVCVIPTASATPESSMESAVSSFETHGGAGAAVGVAGLTVDNPGSASDPAVVGALGRCTGYFFVGGVQARIVTLFRPEGRPTPALETVTRRFREGAVLSGSSAGAAVMSDPMIAGGASGAMAGGVRRSAADAADDDSAGEDDPAPVTVTPGLGFFPALVDQHFLARGRFGRLLVAVLDLAEFDLGFGIDENTALVVEGDTARAVGASGVVVVDAREAPAPGAAAAGARLHLMSGGDRFDLLSRTLAIDPAKRSLDAGTDLVPPEDPFARWAFLHLLEGFAASHLRELALPVPGGWIALRKQPGFVARGRDGGGVQGTTAGLSLRGLSVELDRGR